MNGAGFALFGYRFFELVNYLGRVIQGTNRDDIQLLSVLLARSAYIRNIYIQSLSGIVRSHRIESSHEVSNYSQLKYIDIVTNLVQTNTVVFSRNSLRDGDV